MRCCHREVPSGGSLSAHTGNHSVIRTREDRALTTSATGRGVWGVITAIIRHALAFRILWGVITAIIRHALAFRIRVAPGRAVSYSGRAVSYSGRAVSYLGGAISYLGGAISYLGGAISLQLRNSTLGKNVLLQLRYRHDTL